MKITISYRDGEEQKAAILQKFSAALLDGAKVKRSDRHPPYKHIYVTTRNPAKPGKQNTCTL